MSFLPKLSIGDRFRVDESVLAPATVRIVDYFVEKPYYFCYGCIIKIPPQFGVVVCGDLSYVNARIQLKLLVCIYLDFAFVSALLPFRKRSSFGFAILFVFALYLINV